MSIGKHIHNVRKHRLGLTQRELAALLDVDQVTVSRWERGEVTPRISSIRQLAEIAGLKVETFFEDAA